MSVIEIQQTGRVRTLRLNRPAKMNALSEELAWGIVHAVKDAQADQDTPASGMGQQDLISMICTG